MITLKQFKKEHQKELDAQFKLKYPNGQFVFQRRNSINSEEIFGLYRNKRRNTSHTKYTGICVIFDNKEIKFEPYQNNSFGKCNYFDSLDKLITFATGKISNVVIQTFKRECEDNPIR